MIIEKIAIVGAGTLVLGGTIAQAASAGADVISSLGPLANAGAMGALAWVLWNVFDQHTKERSALMTLLTDLASQIGKLGDRLQQTNDNCAKHGSILYSLVGRVKDKEQQ